ncbi:hypothetical protein BV25DRAFT_1626894 [Artomyces pyxidatus]|uniref:Uncharacterized protein n=1 Tax=Artomyces pyxidatus TaxID=48021 RepID=A0ACB8SJR1_9AGAM|nr:hypothetical protein BV25DRAFT_1626894 [Artomyces pyxidatus]
MRRDWLTFCSHLWRPESHDSHWLALCLASCSQPITTPAPVLRSGAVLLMLPWSSILVYSVAMPLMTWKVTQVLHLEASVLPTFKPCEGIQHLCSSSTRSKSEFFVASWRSCACNPDIGRLLSRETRHVCQCQVVSRSVASCLRQSASNAKTRGREASSTPVTPHGEVRTYAPCLWLHDLQGKWNANLLLLECE